MMEEEFVQTFRLVFLDKRAILWFVFVTSVFAAIGLVESGAVLLPGHTCAPDAWPSHSKQPLYTFDKTRGRWEQCH